MQTGETVRTQEAEERSLRFRDTIKFPRIGVVELTNAPYLKRMMNCIEDAVYYSSGVC